MFFDRIPDELIHSDYIFIVEIETQTNYLFYKGTLIDQFSVSTGSKTRYKGESRNERRHLAFRLTYG